MPAPLDQPTTPTLPPLVLPEKPAAEPAATYGERMNNWWRECDVLIRARQAEQQALCHAFVAGLATQAAPTLDALSAAWDGLDTTLNALAAALRENAAAPTPSGLSESFMLQLLTLILRQPPTQSPGG